MDESSRIGAPDAAFLDDLANVGEKLLSSSTSSGASAKVRPPTSHSLAGSLKYAENPAYHPASIKLLQQFLQTNVSADAKQFLHGLKVLPSHISVAVFGLNGHGKTALLENFSSVLHRADRRLSTYDSSDDGTLGQRGTSKAQFHIVAVDGRCVQFWDTMGLLPGRTMEQIRDYVENQVMQEIFDVCGAQPNICRPQLALVVADLSIFLDLAVGNGVTADDVKKHIQSRDEKYMTLNSLVYNLRLMQPSMSVMLVLTKPDRLRNTLKIADGRMDRETLTLVKAAADKAVRNASEALGIDASQTFVIRNPHRYAEPYTAEDIAAVANLLSTTARHAKDFVCRLGETVSANHRLKIISAFYGKDGADFENYKKDVTRELAALVGEDCLHFHMDAHTYNARLGGDPYPPNRWMLSFKSPKRLRVVYTFGGGASRVVEVREDEALNLGNFQPQSLFKHE